MTEQPMFKETILYYPTISIPNINWLKQVLLYWDEIGSIVPQNYEDKELIPYTPEINYLKDEGEFRPFRTDYVERRDWEKVQEFESELVDAVTSDSFQRNLLPLEYRNFSSRIHKNKVSYAVYEFLEDAGLAINHHNLGDWYYFESQTALLYMSLLAKFIADVDENITVPGTNVQRYAELSYGIANQESFPVLAAEFFNVLPIPTPNNSLQDIIHYKRNRKDELLAFRLILKDFQKKISKCEDVSEVRDVLSTFQNKIRLGLNKLEATLKDAKILTVSGSSLSLVGASSPGWLAPLAEATKVVEKISVIPVEWLLSGAGVLGLIAVGTYQINRRNEKRSKRRDSSFTYLYDAKRLSMIQ